MAPASLDEALLARLGATAVRAVLGGAARLGDLCRSVVETVLGPPATVTLHPAAVLRLPDGEARREPRARLVADLATAARIASAAGPA